MTDLRRLAEPFPRANVHWRVQGTPYERNGKHSAMALAYIDARDVMDRLDEVCGPEGWQDEYIETPTKRVICRIGILTGNGWVWKGDGAGATDVEGEKGGISDALKRAAVQWGIGRYLYRLDSPWVACEVTKKGDKVYWKKWAEDPWSKVKEVGYQPTLAPEAAEPEDAPQPNVLPTFNPGAASQRLLLGIAKRNTVEKLREFYREERGTLADLLAADPATHALVDAAFKTASAKLNVPMPTPEMAEAVGDDLRGTL